MSVEHSGPIVGVVMGSDSDLPTMEAAIVALGEFDVPSEVRILSAHRTPDAMLAYARTAEERGVAVIIAGAGGAAHLPGMIAAATPVPVIGVPVVATPLAGVDALLSIVQMPAGVPVATVAVGNARNAGLLAVRMLGIADGALRDRMRSFQQSLSERVAAKDEAIRSRFNFPPETS
ncbi:MAG: 5-(carboxyamino)imidazole ribonucleotide mutase [Chloroflexia bacterium]|nr:5-(carboxyamino)imidazole ribonucleotide mutase [Chloroflexia bacterium]MBA3643352.1 5-(carboxyamino)imidazole ribonucleotide mutase [Chloroflexia bacterium]